MAADQAIRASAAEARALVRCAQGTRRARYLAVAILGTPYQGRGGLRRHVEYCCINPVKHGLVARVRDWPHSSFHRDVRAGIFPEDWAGDVGRIGEFGERD